MYKQTLTIRPPLDYSYYSFELLGLKRLYPSTRFVFDRLLFPEIGYRYLSFVLPGGRKVVIDSTDDAECNSSGLAWCDVYAKQNLDPVLNDGRDRRKLICIGPSFPVCDWGLVRSWARALADYWTCRKEISDARRHFSSYLTPVRHRVREEDYRPSESSAEYIFFAAPLWPNEPLCNRSRADFMAACKDLAPGVQVEVGFTPRSFLPVPGFEDLLLPRRYTLREYLERTRRSAVAFNTPAVLDCHSWRLGEYLALGKAIISTPLARALPAPLEHGKAVHFVDGSRQSLTDALDRLLRDHDYRRQLERGARRYYDAHVAPEKTIERILAAIS